MRMTVALLAVTVAVASIARGEWVDLEANWSGASHGNSVFATATFSLNTSAVSNPGTTVGGISSFMQNFELTLSGASSGNGVFTASDFSLFVLSTGAGTLDFHSELVGQSTPGGLWGLGTIPVGDFNFFNSLLVAPTGSSAFVLMTNSGEQISLTSLHPVIASTPVAVPETETWVMGMLAVGAVFIVARRPFGLAKA